MLHIIFKQKILPKILMNQRKRLYKILKVIDSIYVQHLFFLMKSKTVMQVSLVENIRWKELGLLFSGWIMILGLEIAKVGIHDSKFEFFIFC